MNVPLKYLIGAMFNTLPSLSENYKLYSLEEEELTHWTEMTTCHVENGTLPLILYEVPSFINDMVGVGRPHGLAMEVVQVHEEGNSERRTVEQSPKLTTLGQMFSPCSAGIFESTSSSSSASIAKRRSMSWCKLPGQRKKGNLTWLLSIT